MSEGGETGRERDPVCRLTGTVDVLLMLGNGWMGGRDVSEPGFVLQHTHVEVYTITGTTHTVDSQTQSGDKHTVCGCLPQLYVLILS